MEEIIEIDLNDKYDVINKYNEKKVSHEMLDYIIKQARTIKKNKRIKVIINKKCCIDRDVTKMIKEGLKEEYNRSLEKRARNNIKQIIFLFLGIVFIFLSTLIPEQGLWKEILLITGWVPIWEMIEVELFPDVEGRIKRKVITKLLNSEILEKSIIEV